MLRLNFVLFSPRVAHLVDYKIYFVRHLVCSRSERLPQSGRAGGLSPAVATGADRMTPHPSRLLILSPSHLLPLEKA